MRLASIDARFRCVLAVVLLCGFVSAGTNARQQAAVVQEPKPTVVEGELTLAQVHKLSGTQLSQATNERPAGELQLRGYILEALQLPKPVTTEIEGVRSVTSRAWRLTVKGGPFPVRAMPAIVWLDDVAVGYGTESTDLKSLSVIIFNRNALREGATISVSYGVGDDSRSELPDRLTTGNLRREGNKQ